jgi:hypothetical protein
MIPQSLSCPPRGFQIATMFRRSIPSAELRGVERMRHDDRRDRMRGFGMRGDRDGASVSGYDVKSSN